MEEEEEEEFKNIKFHCVTTVGIQRSGGVYLDHKGVYIAGIRSLNLSILNAF